MNESTEKAKIDALRKEVEESNKAIQRILSDEFEWIDISWIEVTEEFLSDLLMNNKNYYKHLLLILEHYHKKNKPL
jgi:hypothetical protein